MYTENQSSAYLQDGSRALMINFQYRCRRGRSLELQETMFAQLPVEIPLADSENFGRVSSMSLAGLDRHSDMS